MTQGEVTTSRKKSKAQKANIEGEIICPDRRSKCPTVRVEVPPAACWQKATMAAVLWNTRTAALIIYTAARAVTTATRLASDAFKPSFHVIDSYRKFHSTPIRSKPGIYLGDTDENEIDEQLQPVACGYRRTCPAHSTCCEVSDEGRTKHMCCPLKNGVCCENACCPPSYHCRPNGKCEKHAARDGFIDFGF
ncbi:granulin [Ancylostoma duodenale]|uniref:Granulin n=1 Tax=Ancylostoma duodenale TaxID=51022 RepID=A0A0C2DM96_9BILA|nr:granulin [Ancylostoma duodenale]